MSTVRASTVATLVGLIGLVGWPATSRGEPTEPVVIGWWSYFTPEGPGFKVPTTDARHAVTSYGDPDTYYYEPSGAHGLQEDPNVLPAQQAWQTLITFILSKTQAASLSPEFTIDTTSDLNQFTEAYYGWALVLLYVPKDKYCDRYRIHVGSVDDGVQAMANAKVLGYANLGDRDRYIDMVELQTGNLVLRPGINEIILIHEDQQAVQRYIHDAWIEHDGQKIPLAAKNVVYGRVSDAPSARPIDSATVTIAGNGVSDSFGTGPYGFYFFADLRDGTYQLLADAVGHQRAMGDATVALGQARTEVVRTDFALAVGCACPSGQVCGPSGGCLDPCTVDVDQGERCEAPGTTCVRHVCVKNPCDTLACAPGFRCEPGTAGSPPVPVGNCVEIACSNVCCAAGQVCSQGACVANNCGAGCPAGQTCAGGACVDACSVLTCVTPLVCRAGTCVEPCVADPASCRPDAGEPVDAGGSDAGGSDAGRSDAGRSDGGGEVDSGCGCHLAARGPGFPAGGVALLFAAAVLLRRRERRERRDLAP